MSWQLFGLEGSAINTTFIFKIQLSLCGLLSLYLNIYV